VEVRWVVGMLERRSECPMSISSRPMSDYISTLASGYRWTIWPVTLERRQAMGEEKEDVKADGEFNIPDDIKAVIKPNHHQFYGNWKTVIMDDGMEKWTGYQGKSTQVDANGEEIG
jgi:hypothetical protein